MIIFSVNNLKTPKKHVLDTTKTTRKGYFAEKNSSYDSLRLYIKELTSYPRINREEEISLAEKIEKGGEKAKEARDKLFLSNLRLVVDRAVKRRILIPKLDIMDLIQEGNKGLYRATKDYNGENAFSTYAIGWIDNHMQRAEDNQYRIIRLPVNVEYEILALKKVIRSLSNDLRREPSLQEISQKTKMPIQKIRKLIALSCDIESLDKKVMGEKSSTSFYNFIEDEKIQKPTEITDKGILKERLKIILNCLNKSQRESVILYFGLFGNPPLQEKEIAEKLNITHQAVSCRLINAMKNLRKFAPAMLKEFKLKSN